MVHHLPSNTKHTTPRSSTMGSSKIGMDWPTSNPPILSRSQQTHPCAKWVLLRKWRRPKPKVPRLHKLPEFMVHHLFPVPKTSASTFANLRRLSNRSAFKAFALLPSLGYE